jgi:hypothetical protein
MSVRRWTVNLSLVLFITLLAFSYGSETAERAARHQMADRDAKIETLRADMARTLAAMKDGGIRGTGGHPGEGEAVVSDPIGRALLVEEIKKQLQDEMGLLPVQLLRERQASFVELYAYDNSGRSSYGTAGYLGNGYFITVKHGVEALAQGDGPRSRKIESIKLLYHGRYLAATVVDAGDADVEVHPGDWAILKVRDRLELPPLRVNLEFAYQFAEPIVRLGNDYSKGIILSTGYVGQHTNNGLVTCLTDGHPGVSGGGVLDAKGNLVGIPIGRMQGDFRFSFILPLRREMFRRIPKGVQGHEAARVGPAAPAAVPIVDHTMPER